MSFKSSDPNRDHARLIQVFGRGTAALYAVAAAPHISADLRRELLTWRDRSVSMLETLTGVDGAAFRAQGQAMADDFWKDRDVGNTAVPE